MTRREARFTLPFLLLCNILALILLVLTSGSCGPSARQKTLQTTLTGVNAVRDGFLAFDEQHQNHIADTAPVATVKDQLISYRLFREPMVKAFEVAYRAIAIAAIDKNTPLATVISLGIDLGAKLKEFQSSLSSAEAPSPSSP